MTGHDSESCDLTLNGIDWALSSSIQDLIEAEGQEYSKQVKSLRLRSFDLDVGTTTRVLRVLKRHSSSLKNLVLDDCSGHVDLVLTVALTSVGALEHIQILTGQLSSIAFDPCAQALGVGLPLNRTLRKLTLKAGGDRVVFSMSTDAAEALSHGLSQNCVLECFDLRGCRLAEAATAIHLARGFQAHKCLKSVAIVSCCLKNGQPLDDRTIARLIYALRTNERLESLNISGNQCFQAGLEAISGLLPHLRHLDVSSQFFGEMIESETGDVMDLSVLVGALARTHTLESLELRFNQLSDVSMAYLASALSYNTSIQYVGLNNNHFSDEGLSILASKMSDMKGVTRLHLLNNDYTSRGVSELANVIHDNWSLQRLELDDQYEMDGVRITRFYTDLNWAGRRFLDGTRSDADLFPSLWALVLARTGNLAIKEDGAKRRLDNLYYLVRFSPALFPR